MLDPAWLRSFLTVARTLSFTQAAAILSSRQSTVSEHVRKLEAASGARLFARDTHRVALTSDGEAMIGFATSILDTHDRALRHFARTDLRGRIRLGVSEDVALAGLPALLRRFTAENPHVVLELTVTLSEHLRDKFDRGELDLAFLKKRRSDSPGELVWRDPLVWIAAPDHGFDPERPIPLIVLEPPAITRAIALEALERVGQAWSLVCSSGTQSGIHAAVLAGLGVAPHARSLAPAGVVEVRDERLPVLGEIEFAILAARLPSHHAARALVETIKTNGPLLRRSQSSARRRPLGGRGARAA